MNEIKGIVSENEVDISKVAMIVNGVDKGWEVRTQDGKILWGADRTLTGTDAIQMKGYGLPLKSVHIKGNGQQSGTPTPQSIIMPTFCGVRTGNLLSEKYENRSINGVGAFTIDNNYDLWLGEVIPGQTYAISNMDYVYGFFTAKPSPNTGVTYNGSRGYESSETVVVTIPSGCTWIAVRVSHSADNAMLNTGSTALPYEPYGWKVPVICAGQTVPVYLGEVPTVRRVKKLVLDGTEDWRVVSGKFYLDSVTPDYMRSANNITHICSHFDAYQQTNSASNVPDDRIAFGAAAYSQRLYCTYTGVSTPPDFKAYLADQYAAGTPVTVWYVLAELTTAIVNEPLCKIGDYADELHSEDAGVTIPTTVGTNTLTIDTSLAPSRTEITGHVKNVAST